MLVAGAIAGQDGNMVDGRAGVPVGEDKKRSGRCAQLKYQPWRPDGLIGDADAAAIKD